MTEVNTTQGLRLYDVENDSFREVTQGDVDKLRAAAERGALQRAIVQNVLTMDLAALRDLATWLKRSVVSSVGPSK